MNLEYSADVVLRNGSTFHVRLAGPADAAALRSLYEGLSAESRQMRFLHATKFDESFARKLLPSGSDGFTMVGELGNSLIGAAHCFREAGEPGRAEVAFAIADEYQGLGIATHLLERMADVARETGVEAFEAEVLEQNGRMLEVFRDCGFRVESRRGGGSIRVRLDLSPTAEHEARAGNRAREAATASMKMFFEPRSVAVVGANRGRGKIGSEVLHNLRETGFAGKIYPVNPGAAEIDGLACFAHVRDVPDEVDLAVIVVPASAVDAAIDDCIAKGVPAVVVISAGFGEMGPAGREREAALLKKIRSAGMRLIGPNCMGILNTDSNVRLNATFSPIFPPAGTIGLSSQSGALGLAILDFARQRNIGISTFVSVGNKADVSGNDLIQYWADDPRTEVILLYLESFGNPRNFSRLAREISKTKPIVAVKAGRSSAGARAASSHTGALAASDAVVDALFHQAGVIRTSTIEEFFDVAALLAHQPVPAGNRVAILTNAGGPGILAADACEAMGLELPALSEGTIAALRSFLPAAASISNPVDMLASGSPEQYRRSIQLLLADDRVDSLLVIFIPPLVTDRDEVAKAIVEATRGVWAKPVLATFLSAQGAPQALSPIPCYPFPESAATALARASRYGRWRSRPAGRIPAFPDIDRDAMRQLVGTALERGGGWLSPAEVDRFLGLAKIDAAASRFVSGADEAARAAAQVGFPVAIKAVGPTILHKTEVGGVALSLENAGEVREAYAEMAGRIGSAMTGAAVQAMVEGGVEVIAGATHDPTFGPLVVYGSGGTLVELLSDAAFRLHPVTDRDVAEMIDEVKGSALLRGYRGSRPADEAALRELLLRVSAVVELCPEIQEMDLNPVKVLERGLSVVDARIRVERRPVTVESRRVSY
jgi:acetyl coenzyme A synthetase (ADP forming)-like protein